ncbi:helix-turn-helix transcriptional regulator [Clostridium perfringens]|uniref:helix-turn-helix domain-containing protein n=1 Tax=Clostridium perfringens TaxID=1502 RepID=UPI00016BD73B|nr:helix-turn-helix transcriptional regulator [Clostridium perfringens]EDT27581.1 putative pQC542.18 [Clostridium perfringens CPE str. F4969]EGT2192139.1 helix-turn-helix domain-containing protein [Clostridium perfringens]EHA0993889.1 helix-turn-helix transcriptional regulator [Clostridium perfringens]EHA1184238.1 helix-turn-helix transcriptional regulator [Clostridium perfringens]EJT6142238.1 helix-turn-helix transcriptional regulator [Clostridium perfringens]
MKDERAELRRLRKINFLTIQDVANYIGISKSAISQYESYKIRLKEEHLQKYREFVTK